MKTTSFVISIVLTMFLFSCAATPEKSSDGMVSSPEVAAADEIRTPRFAQMADALDYLGNSLNEEIYRLKMSDGFSASGSASTGQDEVTTPEDDTRSRAEDVMDELDQEIAKQDGGGSQAVTSNEQYTSTESSKMASRASAPIDIAGAEFVNDDGKISQLGRSLAEKQTT